MSLKKKSIGDVVVLTPKGSLIGDEETSAIQKTVKELIAEGTRKVVLDLAEITWVNSAGLGAMISALTSMNKAGGDLRLANVTDKIRSLFLITQLFKVFKTFDSIAEAAASFQSDPPAGVPPLE
ncbi:MAG: STAS domain-containing protein [Bacteroidota bacterium]|nr:STAS domain-containing protein [Bacteroidota bacterium]